MPECPLSRLSHTHHLTTHYADYGMVATHCRFKRSPNVQPMTATDAFRQDALTRQDSHLPNDWTAPAREWDRALGTEYAGHQALVGSDVLWQHEAEACYDAGFPSGGVPRNAAEGDTLTTLEGTKEGTALGWERVRDLAQGTITRRTTSARPGAYSPPVNGCDHGHCYNAWRTHA